MTRNTIVNQQNALILFDKNSEIIFTFCLLTIIDNQYLYRQESILAVSRLPRQKNNVV